jgi:hypothetical protein
MISEIVIKHFTFRVGPFSCFIIGRFVRREQFEQMRSSSRTKVIHISAAEIPSPLHECACGATAGNSFRGYHQPPITVATEEEALPRAS